jgi:hypothetical protein
MGSASMAQGRLSSGMAINTMGNSITDYCTVEASLLGLMESSTRDNSLIIVLQVEDNIVGRMEVTMKEKWKMAYAMDMVNTPLTMLFTKESGLRGRSMEEERLSLQVGVFLRDLSRMIWRKGLERCITILLATFLKESGNMIRNQEWGRWTGLIFDRSMLEIGRIIIKKDGGSICGCSPRAKASISAIDMKVIGKMEWEMALVCFTMRMARSMKVIGRIIWNKALLSILMKMERLH